MCVGGGRRAVCDAFSFSTPAPHEFTDMPNNVKTAIQARAKFVRADALCGRSREYDFRLILCGECFGPYLVCCRPVCGSTERCSYKCVVTVAFCTLLPRTLGPIPKIQTPHRRGLPSLRGHLLNHSYKNWPARLAKLRRGPHSHIPDCFGR